MASQKRSTPTIQYVAAALRVAHAKGGPALVEALAMFAADRVTVRHHPPRQYVDGEFSGAEWIAFERSVVEKVGARAPEMKSEDKNVSVVDDTIVVEEVIVGQDPAGTTFRIPSRLVLPIRDGQILGYDAYYDAAATPPFMQDTEIAVRERRYRSMTIHEMALQIHAAHKKGVLPLLDVLEVLAADQVTIAYHPARPFVEGTMSGSKWIAFERGMVAKAEERALGVQTLGHKIVVDGDDILLDEVELGTGPDGRQFRIPFRAAFHVRDGQIIGYDAYFDPNTTPAFFEQDEKLVRESLDRAT